MTEGWSSHLWKKSVHRIEQCRALEQHAYLASEHELLLFVHFEYVTPIVESLSLLRCQQSYNAIKQYGFSGTALSNDEGGAAIPEHSAYVVEYGASVELLVYVLYLNHYIRICVNIISEKRMSTLLLTTAFVLALPTSPEPPVTR